MPRQAAVLGAGVMGGGIAYTSALRGTPALLKDISPAQLELGMAEARKLIAKQVKRGLIDAAQGVKVLDAIHPQLDYSNFDQVNIVVEAVVENIGVKRAVLREVEAQVRPGTVIASNTSSLRIDDLAGALLRPEDFVGMHFFNPVPVMPLVEVIRGAATRDAAVAAIVDYSLKMGKTPIVVKDGPGFLVNRVLMPYMMAASHLIADGADFEKIDRAMEAFGWPMGPNYLNDVIGMDVGSHVTRIISAGFVERMQQTWTDSVTLMVEHGRLGQKTGSGFYQYESDSQGKPKKSTSSDTRSLLAKAQRNGTRDFSEQEIVERMMLPMIIEAAHALEDGVVASAAELDQALLLGLGFPRHLGGALRYADSLGLEQVVRLGDRYQALGPMYRVTAKMREMGGRGQRYYE